MRRNYQQLVFGIKFDCRFWNRFAVNLRISNREIERIQNKLTSWFLDSQLHRLPASEGELFEVGFNPDRVFSRPNLFWQFAGCAGEIERFFGVERSHNNKQINQKSEAHPLTISDRINPLVYQARDEIPGNR